MRCIIKTAVLYPTFFRFWVPWTTRFNPPVSSSTYLHMPKAHGCELEHLDVCACVSGDFDIQIFFFDIQNVFIGMLSHAFWYRVLSVLLLSEGASSWKACFSSCRRSENSGATSTQNYCLCVAKAVDDSIASWASHIHEIGIGALHKVLLLGFPLLFLRGTKEILCKRHVLMARSSLSGSKILIPYHFSFMLNSPLLGSRGFPSLHWFIYFWKLHPLGVSW